MDAMKIALTGLYLLCVIKSGYSQCDVTTKPLTLTATAFPQTLMDPGGDGRYANNLDCGWIMTATDGASQIIINIYEFRTEDNCDSSLTIYNGVDNTGAKIDTSIEAFCGNNADLYNEYISTGSSLYFEFVSAGGTNYKGYTILYFIADPNHQVACGTTITGSPTTATYSVISPNLPNLYSTDFECSYTFDTTSYGLTFNLQFMDLETDCNNDYFKLSTVSASNGDTNQDDIFCIRATDYNGRSNNFNTKTYASSDYSSVIIDFKTDSDKSTVYYGYMFTYQWIYTGIELVSPLEDVIVSFEVSEDIAAASTLNSTLGVVILSNLADSTFVKERMTDGSGDVDTTLFDLDPNSAPSYYITLAAAGSLDIETQQEYTLIILFVASAYPLLTFSTTFSIVMTDVDDNDPVFTNLPASVAVTRDATVFPVGYSLFTAVATDNDLTESNKQITYIISSGDTYSVLNIVSSTGEITIAQTIGDNLPITIDTYTVEIGAYDGVFVSGTTLVTTAALTITLPPVGISISYPNDDTVVTFEVAEDITVGSVLNSTLGYITYTNGGGKVTNTYQETLADGSVVNINNLFVLDSSNVITTWSGFDYETQSSYALFITLVDSNYPSVTFTTTFSVLITDVDDNDPVITNLPSDSNIHVTKSDSQYPVGTSLFTLTTTDADGTAANQQVTYNILSGDQYDVLSIDNSTGEVTVGKSFVDNIPAGVTYYAVELSAYSGTRISTKTTGYIFLYITEVTDSPPVCDADSVVASSLDLSQDGAGKIVAFTTAWSCTDEAAISYSISSVSPSLTTTLFYISSTSGELSLLRSFDISEVSNRIFTVEITATDTSDQTVSFSVSIPVIALSCSPNPRPLYARMDDATGTVVLRDFQCTSTTGLIYNLTQYPAGIFELQVDADNIANIVLIGTVYKLRFYTLKVSITDGVDTVGLDFRVTIQMNRCGINDGIVYFTSKTLKWMCIVSALLLWSSFD